MISEKKLITDLKKMKKCMFLLNFENFKIMIFTISTKKLLQYRNSDLKEQNTVMRLRKSLKDF